MQLGKYEFYSNEDVLKILALIESFFEKYGSNLNLKKFG
jgi:hypothetical protein